VKQSGKLPVLKLLTAPKSAF